MTIFEIVCLLKPVIIKFQTVSLWKPHAQIVDFTSTGTFKRPEFSYIYRPPTTANRKFLAKAQHAYFVGMNNDERLRLVINPQPNRVDIVTLSHFLANKEQHLSPMTTLLDGLSRQSEYDHSTDSDSYSEAAFLRAFEVDISSHVAKGNLKDPVLPLPFNKAVNAPY